MMYFVRAVVGENGAGKSTLMKILSGSEQADHGEIRLRGRVRTFRNPHEAIIAGIAMIHQELMPFPELTVAENIYIGQEPTGFPPGWIARRKQADDTRKLLGQLGVALSPHTKMRDLSVAAMQVVEIAKAVARQAEVIIMDEPTSALSAREVSRLARLIRDLQARSVAVIYVTHKLEEVFALASRVTVLRDGRHISTTDVGALDRHALIVLMAGRELASRFAKAEATAGEETLAVSGLTRRGKFRNISFRARRGEVLGITGLMGAGRTEVLNAIYGLAPADAGEIRVNGRIAAIRRPRDAIAAGIAMVSEDRKESGLILSLSAKVNLTLGNLARCCRAGFIQARHEAALADEQIQRFGVKVAHRDQTVGHLSGGNGLTCVQGKGRINGKPLSSPAKARSNGRCDQGMRPPSRVIHGRDGWPMCPSVRMMLQRTVACR